jgi:hypothetical protein
MVIAVDFDGTCVSHDYPKVGEDIGSVPVLKALIEKGHQLILWTMRSDRLAPFVLPTGEEVPGDVLTQAINWFKDNEIPLYGVQRNPGQSVWTDSPKCYAQLYIDDAALGCPLTIKEENWVIIGKPFVDWDEVREILEKKSIL